MLKKPKKFEVRKSKYVTNLWMWSSWWVFLEGYLSIDTFAKVSILYQYLFSSILPITILYRYVSIFIDNIPITNFFMNKNKKIYKVEKIHRFQPSAGKPISAISWETDFSHQLGKLASDLKMNITKMGKTLNRKIYDNFRFSVHILVKIIVNFSDLIVFPIFVIFIFKPDTNFHSLHPKSRYFQFYCQKNTSILTLSREFDY